jgi:LacI family transcriptional regulator
MITMKEIAKMVGVSQASVSRVINGNPSVDPDVRLKVMKLVKKYDYKPNVSAQNLVGNKTKLIGVIIPHISNPFFSEIIMAIEGEASLYGYRIILCNSHGSLNEEKNYVRILKSYNVDGILITPCNYRDKYFQGLKDSETPIIVITQDVPGFSCISTSHYKAGRIVAKHLNNMGYSKYVYIGGEEDDKDMGFKDELKNSGVDIEKDYMFIDYQPHNTVDAKLRKYIIENSIYGGIGIFTNNDIEALLVLHILKEMEQKIPESVALVGFDNTFISKEVSPSMSSVAQPIEEIGSLAVKSLLEKINTDENISEKHIILEPRLVARESSIKRISY